MRNLLIGMMFILLILPQQAYANEQEIYVALGDSLAAGQTPYSQIDAGYTDFIALQLMRHGKLANFSKELTFPGYRVEDVIVTVQSEQATQLLENATLVTISAGANNLLPLISHQANTGTLSFNQLSANFALNEVRMQMKTLLKNVREKASNADIYVMGYYFPYTSVHDEQMAGAKQALKLLNDILNQEARKAEATFLDVYDAFGERSQNYLPNTADVHPNQLGYRIMANVMLSEYSGNDLLQMAEQNMPQPNPLTFEEILSQRQATNISLQQGNYVATNFITSKGPSPLMT